MWTGPCRTCKTRASLRCEIYITQHQFTSIRVFPVSIRVLYCLSHAPLAQIFSAISVDFQQWFFYNKNAIILPIPVLFVVLRSKLCIDNKRTRVVSN
jgi:hypothetical protein